MKQMKCKKCGSNVFAIEVRTDCDDCEHNGWKVDIDDDYQYGEAPDDVVRDMVEFDGECYMGTSHNYGCWIVVCIGCGGKEHLPMGEG